MTDIRTHVQEVEANGNARCTYLRNVPALLSSESVCACEEVHADIAVQYLDTTTEVELPGVEPVAACKFLAI